MPHYELERPSDLGMLVTVGGYGATGSSTVAKILAKKWGLHRVDAGEIMRNKAELFSKDAKFSLGEKDSITNEKAESKNNTEKIRDDSDPHHEEDELEHFLDNHIRNHPKLDKQVDQFLVRMSYYPDMLIEGKVFAAIATSMGIACTLRVWVTASLHARILHVLEREGKLKEGKKVDKKSDFYKEIRTELMKRQSNDMRRWQKLYGQDLSKPEEFNDVILDTTGLDIPRTIKKLFRKIEKDDKLRQRFPPRYLKY
jgi:cytidylate kinase